VVVAVVLFLALIVSSIAFVQVVADFVVDRAADSMRMADAWNRSPMDAGCCKVLEVEPGPCWC